MPSLLDFLATGRIGSVGLGSSAEEVRAALGDPSDVGVRPEPSVLKYEALEVSLIEGRVALLHADLDQPLPSFLDGAGISKETTPAELAGTLALGGTRLEPYKPLTFDRQAAFVSLPGDVVLVFDGLGLRSMSSAIH